MARAPELFLLKADIDEADERLRALRASDAADEPPADQNVADALAASTGSRPARIYADAVRGTFRWVIAADLADGREVVVLANRVQHPELTRGLETEAMLGRMLAGTDIMAPAAYAVDQRCTTLPVEFAVFERLSGTRLSVLDGDEPAMLRGLSSSASYLRRVHDLVLPGSGLLSVDLDASDPTLAGRFASWTDYLRCHLADHIARCASEGAIDASEARQAAALLEAELGAGAKPADRLLHGDPGPDNTILNPDGTVLGMIDWEDALVGDPLFEVASLAAFQPERRWPAIFGGYFPDGRLPDDSRRRFWVYGLRIALARTVMRYRFGVQDVPGRQPAAGRIRRALAVLDGREAA